MNKSQIKIYPLLFVASCMFYNHSRSDEPSPTQAAPADIAEKEKRKQTTEKPKVEISEISFDAQYDSSSKLLNIFTETNNTYNFSMDLSTDDRKQLQKLETIIHYMNLKAKDKKEATLYLISKAKKIFNIDLGFGDYDIDSNDGKSKLTKAYEDIKALENSDQKKIKFTTALDTLYDRLVEFNLELQSSQIKTDKTNFTIGLPNYGSFDFLVTDNSAISFNNNISIFKKFKLKGTDLIYDFVYNQVSKQIIIIPAQNNNNTLDKLSAKPCQDWSDQDQKQFQSAQTQNGLQFACINFENTNPFVNMSSNLTLNNKSYKFSLKTDKDDQYLFSLNPNGTLNNNQHETFQIDTVSGVLKKNAANSPYSFTASLHKLEGMIQGSHFRADISENNPLNTLLNLNANKDGNFSLDFSGDFSGFPQANGDNVAIAPLKTRFRLFDKLNRNVGNGAMSFERLTLSHDNTSSSFVMQNAGFQITSKLPFERIGSQESPKPRDDGGLEFATEFLSFKKFSQNNNDLEFEDLATSKFSATGGIGQMILIDKVKQTQAEGKIWTHFENARIQFINASNSDKLGFISLLTGIGQIKTTDFTELQITNGKKDADGNMQNGFSVRKGLLDIVNDMAVAARDSDYGKAFAGAMGYALKPEAYGTPMLVLHSHDGILLPESLRQKVLAIYNKIKPGERYIPSKDEIKQLTELFFASKEPIKEGEKANVPRVDQAPWMTYFPITFTGNKVDVSKKLRHVARNIGTGFYRGNSYTAGSYMLESAKTALTFISPIGYLIKINPSRLIWALQNISSNLPHFQEVFENKDLTRPHEIEATGISEAERALWDFVKIKLKEKDKRGDLNAEERSLLIKMEEYYGGKEVKFARSEIIIGYQMVLKVLEELHNHDVDTPFQDHTRKNLKQDIRHYKKTLEKLKGNASKTKILVLREPNGTEIWDEDMTFTCHHIICELPAVAQSKELVALRFIQVSNSSCVPDETGYGTDSAGKKATWFLKGWPPTSVGTTDGCQINVQFLVRNTTNAALIVTETSETQNNQPGSIQAPRSSHKYHLINPKEIQEMILNDVPPTEVYKQTSKALKPKEEEQLPTLWCDTSRSVGYSFCSIGEFGNQIEFVSPPSDSKECILNVTWGYSTHPAGIWVKRPCKGNFIYKLNTTVGQRSFDKEEYNKRLKHLRAHPPTGGLIPGSSQDGTEKILTTVVCDKPSCNIDVLGATSVSVHQISNTDCTNMIGLEKGPPLKINILKEGCRVIVTIVGKSVSTTAPSTKPVLTTPKPASAKPKPDRRIGRD